MNCDIMCFHIMNRSTMEDIYDIQKNNCLYPSKYSNMNLIQKLKIHLKVATVYWQLFMW